MKKPQYYTKVKGKYAKVNLDPFEVRMPSPGVWLVHDDEHGKSYRMVTKLGELPALYPFLNLAVAGEKLASFLVKYRQNNVKKQEHNEVINLPSAQQEADDILKFLATLT